MWQETFRVLGVDTTTLAGRILQDQIPLANEGSRLSGSLVERASAVLASRLSLQLARGEKRRLVFLLPNATQSLGRFLAVSLLVADFVHQSGVGVPTNEKGPLLGGDLLLITQHIRECVHLLRNVSIRYRTQSLPLSSFWPIEVFSKYSPPKDTKPRVFVANPGWSASLDEARTFGMVVIDLSHPRTVDHFERIISQPQIAQSPTQIFVTPPCERERIERLREGGKAAVLAWPWDPAAVDALQEVIELPQHSNGVGEMLSRFLWLAEDDEVDNRLADLHGLLVGAMKASNGRAPAAVLEAWGIYHRLRQLSVPLLRLEEERQRSYRTLPLIDRIRMIDEQGVKASGPLASYLDSRWPRIVLLLKETYDTLLRRTEPAKFYALAGCIEELLGEEQSSNRRLRIVFPTKQEASILTAMVGEVVSGWGEALQAGRISVTTVREEPRLVAEGRAEPTILLGFRTSESRYLDVYPGVPVHVISYPYEAVVDEAIQRRIHAPIEELQNHSPRVDVLQSLRLPVQYRAVTITSGAAETGAVPRSARPTVTRRFESNPTPPRNRSLLDGDEVEPLDIDRLAGMSWSDEFVLDSEDRSAESRMGTGSRAAIEFAEITLTTGDRLRFPTGRLVDVYHPTTETKERLSAKLLQPGMQLIVLVDDPYEDLFDRLLEAIREQRDVHSSMALDLWQTAKQTALSKHGGSRKHLCDGLVAKGLSVEYAAVVGWYSEGEDEILAPLKESDFELLARQSGIYSEEALLKATFTCIKQERTIRRQCGRVLSRLLAQIAAGKQYEAALESAKAIGSPLEQLASAVTLCEVEAVRIVSSLSDLT
ncbi:MAG: hypothetical protein L0387_15945 [Acidobacteria bacterium]|nr:hypothetical protein [Acidobacteriota bacterium]